MAVLLCFLLLLCMVLPQHFIVLHHAISPCPGYTTDFYQHAANEVIGIIGRELAHIVLAVKCLPVVCEGEHDPHAKLRGLVQHKVQTPERCLVVEPCTESPD